MSNDLKDIIEAVVRERLEGTTVTEVRVSDSCDHEGDRVIRVMVVFDGSKGLPDSHRMAGLARHLRSRLESENSFSHSVFRFVSQNDAKRLTAEAA